MADTTYVRLRIEGDKEVSQMLRSVGLEMSDLKPAMADIGKYLKNFFAGEVFASQGGVIGENWPRLNAKYAVWKARTYAGRPLLVKTGLMQRSFTSTPTNTSVTIRNSVPYFDYHQAGTTMIPARPMMKVDDRQYNKIVDILSARLDKTIREKEAA